MNGKYPTIAWVFIIVIIGLLSSAIFLPVAQAGPPAQDPRPTVGPPPNGNGGGAGGTGGSADSSGSDENSCASVTGQVINWGYGSEGGVTIDLGDGGWQLSTVSATDGNYGFGGLGIGAATLHVALAPGQAQALQPHIQDAAVYLNCLYPTIANIAVSGAQVTPPATIKMSAGQTTLEPGDTTAMMLTVENGLPTDITNVVVTHLIPRGLVALEVAAVAAADARIVSAPDGQLVAVYFDRLASGGEANIRVALMGATDLPAATQVTSTATLFYRESAADQTSEDFTIGRGIVAPVMEATAEIEATPEAAEAAITATPASEPAATPTSQVLPESTAESESGEEFVPPGGLPTTGNDFIPPGFLPVTGENVLPDTGAGFLWPLSGFGLMVLAIVGHYLRSRIRHKR
jgi:uncharacterized repeat protein (TIGR01451 family)